LYGGSINTATGDASIYGAASGRAAYDALGTLRGSVAGAATGNIYTREIAGAGAWAFCYTDPTTKKEFCNVGEHGNWAEILPGMNGIGVDGINWANGGSGSGSGTGGSGTGPTGTGKIVQKAKPKKVTEETSDATSTLASALLAVGAGLFALVF
jgi:hypothetical protein